MSRRPIQPPRLDAASTGSALQQPDDRHDQRGLQPVLSQAPALTRPHEHALLRPLHGGALCVADRTAAHDCDVSGGDWWVRTDRTVDPLIKSQLLYHLSYAPDPGG